MPPVFINVFRFSRFERSGTKNTAAFKSSTYADGFLLERPFYKKWKGTKKSYLELINMP